MNDGVTLLSVKCEIMVYLDSGSDFGPQKLVKFLFLFECRDL